MFPPDTAERGGSKTPTPGAIEIRSPGAATGANDRPPEESSGTAALLEGDSLFVALQPIVDLQRGQVFAYEALLRSATPGFAGPQDILDQAVEQQLMGRLGRRVRELALAACPSHPLFLNVHPSELNEHWLVRPDDPIFAHDHPVYLEVTESVPLSHYQLCESILREVRSKGIFLAVDDLGAGYSNLKYIADLAPEIVKLDRGLLAGVVADGRAFTLIRAIVRLCEDLGARVVAEGIETRAELDAVMTAGVHLAQGYFLARPAFPAPQVSWDAFPELAWPGSRQRGRGPAR